MPTLLSSSLGRDWVIYHLTGGGHDLANFASHVCPSGDVVNFEAAGLKAEAEIALAEAARAISAF